MPSLIQKLDKVRLPLIVAHDKGKVENVLVGGYFDPKSKLRFTTNAAYSPFPR